MGDVFDMPDPVEVVRNRVLFTLIERAHGKHWKSPFEMKIILAAKAADEPPIPRDAVLPFMRDIASAIEFYHGAAVSINVETMEARPVRGEATGYVLFDGYTLTIGSLGYQG